MAKDEAEQIIKRDKARTKKYMTKNLAELETEDLEEVVIYGEEELAKRDPVERGSWVHISDIKEEIDEAYQSWGKVGGLSTGFPSLDEKIGGLKAGELLLIGGETNNGKSALAQNIAVNVAREHKVGYITLEMLRGEAGSRVKHMNHGTMDGLDLCFQEEYQIDYRSVEKLFEDGKVDGMELVILDYFQYLGRGMTLDEVARMSKLMKALALKYKIPFIVIVSLRKSDGGKFKRKWTDIEVEDLMGTSAIGYDADIAMVASRKDLDNKYDTHHMYVKVIKSRNMPLDYDDRYVRFKWDRTMLSEPKDEWVPTADTKVEEVTEEEIAEMFPNNNEGES